MTLFLTRFHNEQEKLLMNVINTLEISVSKRNRMAKNVSILEWLSKKLQLCNLCSSSALANPPSFL